MTDSPYNEFFEHAHDGIKEYDNPLPGWWKWLFWGTIFFSIGYYFYYQIALGPSIYEKYDQAVVVQLERQLAELGNIAPDDRTIIRLMTEKADMIAAMSSVFRANCAQCHTADGGGNIGPNLTDDYWKNVKTPADIIKVITNGVPGAAMQSWSNRFREPQIILLAAYVASLRGTTPANPKAPEGVPIPPWPMHLLDKPAGAPD